MSFADLLRQFSKKAKQTLPNMVASAIPPVQAIRQAQQTLPKIQDILVKNYQNPIVQGLSKIQQFTQKPPTLDITSGIKNPVARLAATIPQEIINTPSRAIQAASRLPQSRTPQQVIGNIAGMAELPLSIATFGAGSALRNVAQQGLRPLISQGAKTGLKYGSGFGTLTGLSENRNAPDVRSMLKGTLPYTLTGGVVGAGLGAATPIAFKGIEKGVQLYKKSPLSNQSGMIKLGGEVPRAKKVKLGPTKTQPITPLPWETTEYIAKYGTAPQTPKLIMDTTQQAAKEGSTMDVIGAESIKKNFQDWVNKRRAVKVEGLLKQKEFQDLNNKGLEGIFEFQAGNKTGRYADVKKYFDNKYNELQQKGVDFNYRKDYLPQLWANTQEEIDKVFGRSLGTKPSFTLDAIFKSYQEGIEAGLTPRFTKISDLTGWYESRANKAIADTEYFKTLLNDKLILTPSKAPRDWLALDADKFPKIRVRTGEGDYTGIYKAPPELAKLINNYLRDPQFEQLNAVANFVSNAKNRMLSFGIPKTGLNFHGFNILSRSFLEGGPKSALKTAYYMVRPNQAGKYIEANLSKAPDAIRHGLTLSTHEFKSSLEPATQSGSTGLLGKIFSRIGNKVSPTWNEWFEKPLFEKIIVAKKLQGYESLWQGYAKSMPEYQAKKEAAKAMNTFFGGINWEELGRSRDLQNMFRVIALTPDWLESNVRLGKNMVSAVLHPRSPVGGAYRKALTMFLGEYAFLNVINKANSGHWMYENDIGHTFELESGYTPDGQKRYIRPFGTAIDFLRLPYDSLVGILQGDATPIARAIRNRLSTLIQPAASLIFNVNWKGQPVYGRDKYGQEMPVAQQLGGIASELGTFTGFPAFLREGIDYATGKQGAEQSLLQGFEFPVRYSGGAYSKTQKTIQDILKNQGMQGKELYDLNKMTQGQRPLSERQTEEFKSMGLDYLKDLYTKRERDRKEKEQIESLEGGVLPKTTTQQTHPPTVTMDDILNRKAEEKKKADIIRRVLEINTTTENKLKYLQTKGLSPQDVQNYQDKEKLSLIKRLSNSDTAQYILQLNQKGQLDFKDLFSKGILTRPVANELENKGFITSAEDLMKKLNATTPYGARKVIKTETKKANKKIFNSNLKALRKASTINKSYQTKVIRALSKKPKIPKPKKIKMPKAKKLNLGKTYKFSRRHKLIKRARV